VECLRPVLLLILGLVLAVGGCSRVPPVTPVAAGGQDSVALLAPPEPIPATVQARLAQARGFTARQAYAEAVAELRLAVQEAPLVLATYQELGWNLLYMQQFVEARQPFHAAAALASETALWDALLGHSFLLRGDSRTAHTYYTKALATLEGDSPLPKQLLADLEGFITRGWQVEACQRAREHLQVVGTSMASWRALYASRPALAQPPQEALRVAREAVQKAQSTFGAEDLRVALSVQALARLLQAQRVWPEAETHSQHALTLQEHLWGPDHFEVGNTLAEVATLAVAQHHYAKAESLLQRAVRILSQAVGSERHPRVATLQTLLATALQAQGDYAQAEDLSHTVLATWRQLLGRNHPNVAAALTNLASLDRLYRRWDLAERRYQEALRILEAAPAAAPHARARILGNLANLYQDQARLTEAAQAYRRALELWTAPGQPLPSREIALTRTNLATLYRTQRRYEEAHTLYQEALTLQKRTLGPTHPDIALTQHGLATLASDQGQHRQAHALYTQVLERWTTTFGPLHPHVATTWDNLATLHANEGQYGAALQAMQQAIQVYRLRTQRVRPQRLHEVESEHAAAQAFVARYMTQLTQAVACAASEADLARCPRSSRVTELMTDAWIQGVRAAALAGRDTALNARQTALWADALEVSQLAQTGRTATALAQLVARFARGHDPLAQAVRTYQDAVEQWRTAAEQLEQALSQPLEQQEARRLADLQSKREAYAEQLRAHQASLARDFPKYAELALPAPVTLADLGTLLQADEALLSYVVWPEETFLFVVRPPQIRVYPLGIGAAALQRHVDSLRTGVEQPAALSPNALEPFRVQEAYELYTTVLAPAVPFLQDVRHLLVVPDGALQRLPFHVLVTAPPTESGRGNVTAYRHMAWLDQRYALTVLPAPSALRARRISPAPGKQPVVGFGDPDFTGVSASLPQRAGAPACPQDPAAVRHLLPLPGAGRELDAVQKAWGGDPQYIYKQQQATKPRLLAMDLSPFRHLVFSTHALRAGCYGLTEPALVLTPGLSEDTGLLTASEIAHQLHLNADWTILAACDTAMLEGTPGAAGLASLARAFFYAGTRTLLVSHWAVNDVATATLVEATVRHAARAPEQGRAAALQAAMQQLRDDPTHPYYAHPLFWAPFVVMGDGGAPLAQP